jgi:hypothetical protein
VTVGRALVVAVLLSSLAACAPTSPHPAPAGSPYEDAEVRFVAPAGWQIQASTAIYLGGPGGIRLYLANQAMRADCVDSGSQLVCQSPLANGLRPGGMLVTWWTQPCVASSCDLPAAPLMTIGNRQGVRAPVTDGCEGTGFTERSAYYVTVSPQLVDVLLTCARDPSDATRSAFLGFLDAIHWRIP